MTMDRAHQVLKDVFGLTSFRLLQKEVIERLLVKKQNALAIFPTGGGKSLTFQLPAICLEGLTLVVMPLISIMKDQVDFLTARGVKAARIDSQVSGNALQSTFQEVRSGITKILYISPERLCNEAFLIMLKSVTISLLVVDEAHCISEWGHSFRPDYLKIARFSKEYNVERVLCLTATATQKVVADTCEGFKIHPTDGVFQTPIFRPNLILEIQEAETFEEKLSRVVPILQARTGPAVIYVTLQKQAEELAGALRRTGLNAAFYHAKLERSEKENVQNNFMQSNDGIVCATIAFGMGVDKPNIRLVIHMNLPMSLEGYSQEVGRAGRDGLPSRCIMFLSALDVPVHVRFAQAATCSKKSVESWLREIAFKKVAVGSAMELYLPTQRVAYDIGEHVLDLLYAQLELDHGYLRACAPFYAIFDICIHQGPRVFGDKSPAASAIRSSWREKKVYHELNVYKASRVLDRELIMERLIEWEMNGLITVKPSRLWDHFKILKPLPTDDEGIRKLVDVLYQRMLCRQSEALEKLSKMVLLATSNQCIAYMLACHFGNPEAVPSGKCGQCTVCITGHSAAPDFDFDAALKSRGSPNPTLLSNVVAACSNALDDPLLLARVALGISSPRIKKEKLSKFEAYGCMPSANLNELVTAFEAMNLAGGIVTDVV